MAIEFIFILFALFFIFLLIDGPKKEKYAICNPAIKPDEPGSPSYPLNYQVCSKHYFYDGY